MPEYEFDIFLKNILDSISDISFELYKHTNNYFDLIPKENHQFLINTKKIKKCFNGFCFICPIIKVKDRKQNCLFVYGLYNDHSMIIRIFYEPTT